MTNEELLKEAVRRFRIIAEDARRITLGNISHSTPKKIERYAVESFELLESHIKNENLQCVYVVTRSEEHADYVEKCF